MNPHPCKIVKTRYEIIEEMEAERQRYMYLAVYRNKRTRDRYTNSVTLKKKKNGTP